MKLLTMVPSANTLGEGPLWNDRDGKLWWTDIQESRLHRLTYATGEVEAFDLPERLGSFAFLPERGDRILAAFETGLAYFDVGSGALEWVARIELPDSGRRFNDGRTDRQGRFWVGSMVEDAGRAGEDTGALFSLDQSGELIPHAVGVAISNSLCTSPDGRTLYFADSPKKVIYAFDLDTETGYISNKRFFAEVAEGEPDGAVVDAEGCVWSARWGAGEIVRHAPDGKVMSSVKVPASQVSSLAFGGPDGKTLFVTSARDGLDAAALAQDPGAGNLFIFETDVVGLPNICFGG